MRPVHASPDQWSPTPVWMTVTLLALAAAGGVAAVAVSNTGWWPAAFTVLTAAACVLAWLWARRIARENRGHRIPWFGRPPNRRRNVDLRTGAAGGTLAAAMMSVPFIGGRWWLVGGAIIIWLICGLLPWAMHNSKVAHHNRSR
jgi:hypothetical protein